MTEQTEAVPDGWQYASNPEWKNAWLEQENERLKGEVEKAKASYQGLLGLSKDWEAKYRREMRDRQETARRSFLDGLPRVHSYLVREFWHGPDKPTGKYRQDGAAAVINHLGALAAEQRAVDSDVLGHAGNHKNEPEEASEVDELRAKVDAFLEPHALVHRNIPWTDERGAFHVTELLVCGHCVPQFAHFNRREDIPEGPCATRRALGSGETARPTDSRPDYQNEPEGATTNAE